MNSMVILASFLSVALAVPLIHLDMWKEFKVTHNKIYETPQEEQIRLQVFLENVEIIERHNALYEVGLKTYTMGINQFTDLTDEEFEDFLLSSGPPPELEDLLQISGGQQPSPAVENVQQETYSVPSDDPLPDKVDWRTKNVVNPARVQGSCGACWAFSAAGCLESINAIKTGKLYQLSIQNLMDCSFDYGNYACLGGWAINGLKYVKDKGIETEADYPYEAKKGQCRFDPSKSVVQIQGVARVPKNNITALQSAVATVGPISVSVDAKEFKFYKSGVFFPTQPFKKINHGVILDGYGTSMGDAYWLIRNTWGPTWGENGYIKVAREGKNHIAVTSKACYPLL